METCGNDIAVSHWGVLRQLPETFRDLNGALPRQIVRLGLKSLNFALPGSSIEVVPSTETMNHLVCNWFPIFLFFVKTEITWSAIIVFHFLIPQKSTLSSEEVKGERFTTERFGSYSESGTDFLIMKVLRGSNFIGLLKARLMKVTSCGWIASFNS